MKIIRVTATNARNNFFTILNQVLYEDARVIIEKAGATKEAMLSATDTKDIARKKRIEELRKTYGALKDVPLSHFRDDRIRGRKARKYLEKIRKAW